LGRRLGQHFLNRKSTLNHIAESACGERTPLVIEIGAGRGALTESLLERADKVVAIELDPVLIHYLRQKFRDALDAGRLILVESDILKADLSSFIGAGGPAVIAGNLPYYITSPILERLFAASASWKLAVILVQAEVAARIVAQPGCRDYGYLSVLVQAQARAERLFEVPRTSFRPPPKVDSAVVRLEPMDAGIGDLSYFLKFAGNCFRYKRKTLRNNLAGLYDRSAVEALIGPKDRAEALSVAELAHLFAALREALTTPRAVVYPT